MTKIMVSPLTMKKLITSSFIILQIPGTYLGVQNKKIYSNQHPNYTFKFQNLFYKIKFTILRERERERERERDWIGLIFHTQVYRF